MFSQLYKVFQEIKSSVIAAYTLTKADGIK